MIIHVDRCMAVTVREPSDFRRFNVSVEAGPDAVGRVRAALSGLADLEAVEQAWVSADALREKVGLGDDADWSRAFAAMIEKARPFGWVRDEPLRIAAHIVWQHRDAPSP